MNTNKRQQGCLKTDGCMKNEVCMRTCLGIAILLLAAPAVGATGIVDVRQRLNTTVPSSFRAEVGFPHGAGVSASWWAAEHLALDVSLTHLFGPSLLVGASARLPLFASSHALMASGRAGPILGTTLMPERGLTSQWGLGYGFLGAAVEARVLAGWALTWWGGTRLEVLPHLSLSLGPVLS